MLVVVRLAFYGKVIALFVEFFGRYFFFQSAYFAYAVVRSSAALIAPIPNKKEFERFGYDTITKNRVNFMQTKFSLKLFLRFF